MAATLFDATAADYELTVYQNVDGVNTLVTPPYVASDTAYEIRVKGTGERRERGQAVLVGHRLYPEVGSFGKLAPADQHAERSHELDRKREHREDCNQTG